MLLREGSGCIVISFLFYFLFHIYRNLGIGVVYCGHRKELNETNKQTNKQTNMCFTSDNVINEIKGKNCMKHGMMS